MEWMFGVAIVPLLLCGLMCVVPMALAAVGLRRHATPRTDAHEPAPPAEERDRAEATAQ
jgi:hypothetical protein